ncbi:MAG: hypothetical protein R3F14_45215, partial [Polyangiaceae bacterium]
LSAGAARFELDFTRGQPHSLDLAITCHVTGPEAADVQRPEPAKHHPAPSASIERDFDAAVSTSEAQSRAEAADFCEVSASNRELHRWLNHAVADVRMMCTATDFGPYPYAGVPWYNTAFGRDGIVTALELLWLNPRIARGVLGYLASMQATTVDPQNDAEPGKILHETRGGEMAALGEVPFRRYYGSVDATPLFLCLAGAYYQRTGDLDLIRSLWPSIERAMEWIERYGDADGDGFVEYSRRSAEGLEQQGWKDSHDSVFHADGSLAKPPIALVEVQSYVYSARNSVALLADRLGLARVGEVQRARADALRERFEEAFWCPSMASYGLALDGDKRLCRVHTSNAGHALFGGIARDVRARLVARDLAKPHLFSGWGVRTLSSAAPRYNPMSYHNGSVWPHDNALIAAGLSRYGLTKLILATFQGLFEASQFMPSRRMPELFCGFARRAPEGPTLYPVACSPQSWAAGAPLWLLQSCLGLSIDGPARRVRIKKPRLPDLAPEITLRNLEVSQGRTLDLRFDRHGDDVSVTVLRRDRKIQVAIVK